VCLHTEMEQLQKDFFYFRNQMTDTIKREAAKLQKDPNPKIYKNYVAKYPFLKQTKHPFPSLREVLSWKETKETFAYDTHTKLLLDLFISKITGIFKHGQTMKTALCNRRIISNIKNNKLTIAISKNTLSAKEQWEQRLIDSLREEFPEKTLSEMILIISSKENTLGGNATHCKNVEKASFIMNKRNSAYKLIFICSNNTRIHDMIALLESTKEEQRLPVEIIHDEAHKNDEGIPSKREMIEYLIMHPCVEAYIPVTASPDPIFLADKEDVLWQRANLERNAIDYREYCNIVSTSEHYSSIVDANQLRFAQYENHSSYTNYNIYEFDEETFDEADMPSYYADKRRWSNPDDIKADKNRRRQLEFCSFMAFEKDALNLGMNILDNYLEDTYTEGSTSITTTLILSGVFNFHLMTTPCRVALTISLIKHSLTKSYNPICVGLYRSKIHIWYKNAMGQTIREEYGDLDIETQSQEMNSKLHEILGYLERKGESVERPLLVFGNYKPTGESITFVNYKYGTIRSDTLLPVVGQTREMNYQGFLRCAYTDTKFKEENPSFVHPPKWIIGSEKSINDAITYEQENDQRVLSFDTRAHNELVPVVIPAEYPVEANDKGISIPCKIIVTDLEDMYYKQVQTILKEDIRTEKDKKALLNYFRLLKDNQSLQINDPTGKFDFNTFKIKEVRTWKDHTEEQILERMNKQGNKYTPFEADYRFREYDANHRTHHPYINNKSKIMVNECDFLAAVDRYKLDDFKNTTNIFWISYRYA
jgi:hypothetical protein